MNINFPDIDGFTPLHFAAMEGNESIVRLLLKRKDLVATLRSLRGDTALMFAAQEGKKSIVVMLLERDDVANSERDISYALATAARRLYNQDRLDIVKILMKRDKVSYDYTIRGQTALHAAADNSKDDGDIAANVVRLLLEKDQVSINRKDREGFTPLMLACKNGTDNVVEALLQKAQIEINHRNKGDETALMLAASYGHETVVSMLLARDEIDVNSRNESSQSALMLAASFGHQDIVKLFLEKPNIDVNHRDQKGQTALMIAYQNGHEETVALLEAAGAYGEIPVVDLRQYPESVHLSDGEPVDWNSDASSFDYGKGDDEDKNQSLKAME